MELYSIDLNHAFLFEIAAFFVAAFISRIHVFFLSIRQKKTASGDVHELFNRTWKGYEDDRRYAWFRVRLHLLTFDADPEKLAFVEKAIRKCNASAGLSGSFVNDRGELERFSATDKSVQ